MEKTAIKELYHQAVELLRQMIAIPSFSKEEDQVSQLLTDFLSARGVSVQKHQLNLWTGNKYYDPLKPTLLLNSHFDTVKPNSGYTRDPFLPQIEEGKLFGLGSNDAGGCLVSLIATFLYFKDREDLSFNLVLAAVAEEEISGKNGTESLLSVIGKVDCAIVGEPTLMQMAVAEKGLLVIDFTARGKSGHAARNEGENAITKAIRDINWLNNYQFEKVSPLLGPVRLSVTQINAGTQHNVIPDTCSFVADIRLNELYTHEEVLELLQANLKSEIAPRSTRIKSSAISESHPLVQSGLLLGKEMYGSPTTSDKALMPFPALKMGPGDSARSHTADEFIYLNEIEDGIETYTRLLEQFNQLKLA